MQQVSFHSPTTIQEACDLLDQHGDDARVLAGGQSLIQMLKQRLIDADHVVDITGIGELEGIEVQDGALWIGATETYASVRDSQVVREAVPVLPEMIRTIGDEQIRNRGTLVGGVAHADPEGDPPVLTTAMDATIRLQSRAGKRTVTASNFYEGMYETARRETEIVTAVGFPVLDDRVAAYRSYTPRQGDYAVASVAVTTRIEEGTLRDTRLVVGAVSDGPTRLTDVEAALDGKRLTDGTIAETSERARQNVDPMDDEEFGAAYKERLVETLTEDALEAISESAAED